MATTTNYSWTTPDNTAYVKDGASAIRTLGSSVDTSLFSITGGKNVGLQYISTTSLTGSTTIIANCFSSAYVGYKIELMGVTTSAANALEFWLRTGSTTSTANYNTERLSASGVGVTSDRNATTSVFNFNKEAVDNMNGTITVYNPFVAIATFMHGEMNCSSGNTVYHHQASGLHSLATSYESIVLGAGGGTFTAGVAKIYGLRN